MPKYPKFSEIQSHIEDDDHAGWCIACGEWTHDFCEPDARQYECPECNRHTCFGAEQLLIENMMDMSDDDDDLDDYGPY